MMLFVSLALGASIEAAHAQSYVPRDASAYQDIHFQSTPQNSSTATPEVWNGESEGCGDESCGVDTNADYGYGDVSCGCPSDSFEDFGGCTPNSTKWWFAAEYLLWKTDSTHLPALVTDSPIGTFPVLSSPSTQVLSAEKVAESWRSGYRLELGVWLDECNGLALVGDYSTSAKTTTTTISRATQDATRAGPTSTRRQARRAFCRFRGRILIPIHPIRCFHLSCGMARSR
jgi:hypothetical protein